MKGNRKSREWMMKILPTLLLAIILVIISVSGILYAVDRIVADPLYQTKSSPNNEIKIIAIDEKSIEAYGDFSNWDRQIYADLVNLLNSDSATAPAVIAFDVMFVSNRDQAGDLAFSSACENGKNVIGAVNLVYKDKLSLNENGTISVDSQNIELAEFPFEELRAYVGAGFANVIPDTDSYVRRARSKAVYQGEELTSLSMLAAEKYAAYKGISIPEITTDAAGTFGFTYTGKTGSYEVLSLVDVLNGVINPKVFAGNIVYVGAYAPGLQDAYSVPVQKGRQMYGVEINANITEAILEGKTNLSVNRWIYSLVAVFAFVVFAALCETRKKHEVAYQTVFLLLFLIIEIIICRILYRAGTDLPVLYLPLVEVLFYGWSLVKGYLAERLRRHKVLGAFRKYVAPQVVEQVSKNGDFEIRLGGENRHVAVLFVDIRGFTPMSESLEPEQVVEILNEYLDLTTNSILKNGGTLDKFIGDATMAVFNAPFDLEDYIYRAVCTARDIAAGSEALEKKLMERFGKTVSFGIGVNCGPAVVGNIGCNFRMDYTAIGDTVNTAARLEANAKRGQILISDTVYEALKDRLKVTDVGVIPLKGKSNGVYVYQVDQVL